MAIRSLQHYALSVPDPRAGQRFYSDFGLEAHERPASIALRCFGRNQDQVVLLEGRSKRLHHLAFGTRADEIAALQKRVEAAGTPLVDPPPGTDGAGIWFPDPDGNLVNIRVADAAPAAGAAEWRINQPGNYGRVAQRGCPTREAPTRPRRLGHVLLFTPDPGRQIAFYTGVLGMILSDRSQDLIGFLRSAGDSDHHVIAFFKSAQPGFHHASFEVGNVDEIGVGASVMLEKGYRDGWGLGRHVIGSNFFHYIRDPWNSLAEYFCDIDYIPERSAWEARNWPVEDSLYLWGPRTPPDFGTNFEAGAS